jgi:alpha-glucuronidase
VAGSDSAVLRSARTELLRGLTGLLGVAPAPASRPTRDGAIVFGTARSSSLIAALHLDLSATGKEGYLLRSVTLDGYRATLIAADDDLGVLHGVFQYLRMLQTRQPVDRLGLVSAPRLRYRVLDHWDNLDGFVERGYAGASIWDWHKLPDYLSPRYLDYARACASLGINGTVLTNVNANALSLTPQYLRKAAALAEVFRPYGLRVYLSARFSAPVEIGGLGTADPLDPAVRAWWRAKADEIYRLIPDFGGFLVKADSEGQPGPQTYGRTHADGANLLADALAPHGGIVMDDLLQRSSLRPPGARHDDGITRSRGELHDAPRLASSNGSGPSLWAGSLGGRGAACRDLHLLQPGRFAGYRIRPYCNRQ